MHSFRIPGPSLLSALALVACQTGDAATTTSSKEVAPLQQVTTPTANCGDGAAKQTADFGRGKITGALSIGKVVRGSSSDVYAAFDLQTGAAEMTQRPALNLALVIDHSGSMDGDKIVAAKKAAREIVQRLEERDHVSLIVYDDTAEVSVPAIATDRAGKQKLTAAIDKIEIDGGTNLHDGMVLGHNEVKRTLKPGEVSRVILLSDGQASDGITDPQIIAAASRKAADQGIRTTAVGLGLDYNEDLMEQIAEAGRGAYYYAKDGTELDKVMVGELQGVQATVATNVELRLKPACGSTVSEVIGYESRVENAQTVVPMADLFGNDGRKLLVKLALPVDKLGKLGALTGELSFKDPKTQQAKTVSVALAVDVTDNVDDAQKSIDKDVMAQVMQAQAAQTMRAAAAAYDRGDVDAANKMLDTATAAIAAESAKYDIAPAAAAPAMDSLKEMAQVAKVAAPGSADAKMMLKASKQKARVMTKSAKPSAP